MARRKPTEQQFIVVDLRSNMQNGSGGFVVSPEMQEILRQPGELKTWGGGQKLRLFYQEQSKGFNPNHLHDFALRCYLGLVHDVKRMVENGEAPDLMGTETPYKFGGTPTDVPDLVGYTALHHAAHNSKPAHVLMLARMLLETGASPDARNRYGQVPLDGAIQHNGIGAVELLMEFGADVDVADADDTTPRNFVLKCGPQVTAAMTKGLRKRNGEEAPMEEGKKCVACGKTERLKLCSKCHAAWYCSAACQRANWPMHKQTCQPYSASNAVTVKPNYVRHGKLTSKADFARAVLGIPSDLPPVRQQRHTHVPHLRPDQTKAMVIKVQVPRPIDERHAVHTLSGDLLIYNKKRDFVCSIMKSENPVGYTVITDAVRTKGVGGTKAYFPAELRNKDELAIKVGEVLAEQPF